MFPKEEKVPGKRVTVVVPVAMVPAELVTVRV
jgi:hypothetical protein